MKRWTDIHDDPAGWVDVEITRTPSRAMCRRIREERKGGASLRTLASLYGYSVPYVAQICQGTRRDFPEAKRAA